MPATSLARWAARPENRGTLIALGLLGVTAVGVGIWRSSQRKTSTGKRGSPGFLDPDPKTPVPKGRVLCPKDVNRMPADTSTVKKGDYVVLHLQSHDRSFVEPVWGRVISVSPKRDQLHVQITGEFTDTGLRPIKYRQHGFHMNEKVIVGTDCVFDVLSVSGTLKGTILCGPRLAVLEGKYAPVDTRRVAEGDMVQIVVASKEAQGTAWHEPLWVHVTRISPTASVIHGIVAEAPAQADRHGLSRFSKLDFTRDCVVDITNPHLFGK